MSRHAEAGPSSWRPIENTVQPKVEYAAEVRRFKTNRLEDCLDYAILVSNNASMARDHLANERNWLTWFRLSCTLIILGFTVLLQFRLPEEDEKEEIHIMKPVDFTSKPIGFIFVTIGIACFLVGVGKYFKNQRLLVKQATYIEAGWGSFVTAGLLFSVVCSVMIIASINAAKHT
ncbi:hypothetical protein A0J61_06577 [Choanephora cucurbitarum]|uniref:DUF202 domain-containing protein n=1 Tax=Choanephora cucurbitarum TaxID=101091 RepID=A0A1C7N8C7_9FUNG|nr:hypothetical protein A0J61_06577 [Choanephora cucurbitarum]